MSSEKTRTWMMNENSTHILQSNPIQFNSITTIQHAFCDPEFPRKSQRLHTTIYHSTCNPLTSSATRAKRTGFSQSNLNSSSLHRVCQTWLPWSIARFIRPLIRSLLTLKDHWIRSQEPHMCRDDVQTASSKVAPVEYQFFTQRSRRVNHLYLRS